jgi:iron complex transport system ATP-binding protein
MLGLPNRHDEEAVRLAMQDTGVSALTERHLSEISGGERQRVWLAMALAQEPQVLLLDEPTAFLDLDHQMELMELLRYLNREQGMTIVMVLNDLNLAARYAQRIVMLSEGEVVVDGPPGEAMTPETLREVFGVECRVAPGTDGVEMVILPIRRI